MNKKTRELVLIKSGEYMLDMSKLVFGGIILVGIMQIEGISNRILLSIGAASVVFFCILGLYLIKYSQVNKRKE